MSECGHRSDGQTVTVCLRGKCGSSDGHSTTPMTYGNKIIEEGIIR